MRIEVSQEEVLAIVAEDIAARFPQSHPWVCKTDWNVIGPLIFELATPEMVAEEAAANVRSAAIRKSWEK